MPIPKYLSDKNNPAFLTLWQQYAQLDPFADLDEKDLDEDLKMLRTAWKNFQDAGNRIQSKIQENQDPGGDWEDFESFLQDLKALDTFQITSPDDNARATAEIAGSVHALKKWNLSQIGRSFQNKLDLYEEMNTHAVLQQKVLNLMNKDSGMLNVLNESSQLESYLASPDSFAGFESYSALKQNLETAEKELEESRKEDQQLQQEKPMSVERAREESAAKTKQLEDLERSKNAEIAEKQAILRDMENGDYDWNGELAQKQKQLKELTLRSENAEKELQDSTKDYSVLISEKEESITQAEAELADMKSRLPEREAAVQNARLEKQKEIDSARRDRAAEQEKRANELAAVRESRAAELAKVRAEREAVLKEKADARAQKAAAKEAEKAARTARENRILELDQLIAEKAAQFQTIGLGSADVAEKSSDAEQTIENAKADAKNTSFFGRLDVFGISKASKDNKIKDATNAYLTALDNVDTAAYEHNRRLDIYGSLWKAENKEAAAQLLKDGAQFDKLSKKNQDALSEEDRKKLEIYRAYQEDKKALKAGYQALGKANDALVNKQFWKDFEEKANSISGVLQLSDGLCAAWKEHGNSLYKAAEEGPNEEIRKAIENINNQYATMNSKNKLDKGYVHVSEELNREMQELLNEQNLLKAQQNQMLAEENADQEDQEKEKQEEQEKRALEDREEKAKQELEDREEQKKQEADNIARQSEERELSSFDDEITALHDEITMAENSLNDDRDSLQDMKDEAAENKREQEENLKALHSEKKALEDELTPEMQKQKKPLEDAIAAAEQEKLEQGRKLKDEIAALNKVPEQMEAWKQKAAGQMQRTKTLETKCQILQSKDSDFRKAMEIMQRGGPVVKEFNSKMGLTEEETLKQNGQFVVKSTFRDRPLRTTSQEKLTEVLKYYKDTATVGMEPGHSNSKEYKKMIQALDALLEEPGKDPNSVEDPLKTDIDLVVAQKMKDLETACTQYIDAKNNQFFQSFRHSHMRKTRLNFAAELKEIAKTGAELAKHDKLEKSLLRNYFVNADVYQNLPEQVDEETAMQYLHGYYMKNHPELAKSGPKPEIKQAGNEIGAAQNAGPDHQNPKAGGQAIGGKI